MSYKTGIENKYQSCTLQIYLDSEHPFTKSDEHAFHEVAERIAMSGGSMIKIGNIIDITFDGNTFKRVQTRNCGQKEKAVSDLNDNSVTFADLVYWHYGLKKTWTDIAERLNISRATLFRRKKKYEQYSYYNHFMNTFDRSKAGDLKYLRSLQDGDSLFI